MIESADRVERLNLAVSAGAVAASWWLVSPLFAASLGLGAVLEAVNFRSLKRQAQLLFEGQVSGSRGWTGLYGLRFVLLGIGIVAGLALGAHPVGLAIGLSLIMPTAIFWAWRNQLAPDPNAPALAPDDPAWEQWNPWLAREREPADEDEA